MQKNGRFMRRMKGRLPALAVLLLALLCAAPSALAIDPQADLCTLVTCTPYGINTHRLLVRGHRVETVKERAPVVVMADAVRVAAWKVALAVAAPLMLAFVLAALVLPRRRD